MPTAIYIASQDSQGGVLCCALASDGQLSLLSRYPLDRPAYLCADGRRLYALLREPFQMQSGVAAFDLQADGSLRPAGGVAPTHGTIAAHLWAGGGALYCANYLSGTTIRMPDKILCHNGSSVHPERQSCSHPHCVTPAPDGAYLCVNDLGTDCIYVCTMELEEVSRVRLEPGSGPRHLVFSRDGRYAYCSNELGSSVSVLAYEKGRLTLLRSYQTLPDGFAGANAASAIRLSPAGDRLYVSNRGHNSVCVFEASGESLKPLHWIPSGGDSPREIQLAGEWLLCANENSHNVCVLPRSGDESSLPVCVFPVTRPWCILPVEW